MKLSRFHLISSFNLILTLIAFMQYCLVAPLNVHKENFITTMINIDRKIPLMPISVIPFYSIYLLIILTYIILLFKKDNSSLSIFLFSFILLLSIVNFMRIVFPTMNLIRPDVSDKGFFFDIVKYTYEGIPPYNTFPSLQAAIAVLCSIVLFKLKSRFPLLFVMWAILICLSTLFLKMNYILDVVLALPLSFMCYAVSEKVMAFKVKTQTIQEVVKTFTLESLIQSVAIGIRDESTLSSLINSLTRIEKNLTEKDKIEIGQIGTECDPPVKSLKDVINNLINSINAENHIQKAKEMFAINEKKSYISSDKELKQASEALINCACRPFDNPKFRYTILEIKKRNAELISTSEIEEAARERSKDIIFKFESFIDAHKKNIPALSAIYNNTNGKYRLTFDDVKVISRELRKPPYEISTDEIWNAYRRIDKFKVKPLEGQKNLANIISLTKFAIGKIDVLEPFSNKVQLKFSEWIKTNEVSGRSFSQEEIEWLNMMKNYFASFLEINMNSFNQPPFVNKGGAAKAYNMFGPDLNRILSELNEKLLD